MCVLTPAVDFQKRPNTEVNVDKAANSEYLRTSVKNLFMSKNMQISKWQQNKFQWGHLTCSVPKAHAASHLSLHAIAYM